MQESRDNLLENQLPQYKDLIPFALNVFLRQSTVPSYIHFSYFFVKSQANRERITSKGWVTLIAKNVANKPNY